MTDKDNKKQIIRMHPPSAAARPTAIKYPHEVYRRLSTTIKHLREVCGNFRRRSNILAKFTETFDDDQTSSRSSRELSTAIKHPHEVRGNFRRRSNILTKYVGTFDGDQTSSRSLQKLSTVIKHLHEVHGDIRPLSLLQKDSVVPLQNTVRQFAMPHQLDRTTVHFIHPFFRDIGTGMIMQRFVHASHVLYQREHRAYIV